MRNKSDDARNVKIVERLSTLEYDQLYAHCERTGIGMGTMMREGGMALLARRELIVIDDGQLELTLAPEISAITENADSLRTLKSSIELPNKHGLF